jgi:hypothetical protein
VADGLDVVAVGVQDEGALVVLVVVGAWAGRAAAWNAWTVARSGLTMATWVDRLSGRLTWMKKSGLPSLPKPAEPSRSISRR